MLFGTAVKDTQSYWHKCNLLAFNFYNTCIQIKIVNIITIVIKIAIIIEYWWWGQYASSHSSKHFKALTY